MELIFQYTRKQAIEDGVLVDVTDPQDTRLYKYPVALTSEVYDIFASDNKDATGGWIWDICFMSVNFVVSRPDDHTVLFKVLLPKSDDAKQYSDAEAFAKLPYDTRLQEYTLKAVCAPDDDGSPCITIMLPNQD